MQPNSYVANTPDWIKPYLDRASQKYGVSTLLLSAQINQESGFRPDVTSPAGAQGIAQFMPRTAQAYGVDPFDVASATDGQAHMMSDLIKSYGSTERALSAYNSGKPDAYQDPSFGRGETFNYVKNIMSRMGPNTSLNSQSNSQLQQVGPTSFRPGSQNVLAASTQASQPQEGSAYTVKAGDTLWGLAQKFLGKGSNYSQFGYEGDPRRLAVGTQLNIPGQRRESSSNVLGTTSLILATQADDVVNTSDGIQVTNFNMVFDGTTWDRLRGDATDGALVNLGANNDVTITSGSVTEASGTTIATNTGNAATSLAIMDDWDNAASDGASVSGDVAHDAADAGEPVKIGMKAYSPDGTTPGTAVAELDRTNAKGDLDGRLLVNTTHPTRWSYHSNGSSALTDASVAADPGDGFQLMVTDIVVSTGAATAMNVFFEEGSTTVLGPYYLEAVAGRGLALHFVTPKPITASTALTVTTSAAIAQCVDVLGFIQAV